MGYSAGGETSLSIVCQWNKNEIIVPFLNQDPEDSNTLCLRYRLGVLSYHFSLQQACPTSLGKSLPLPCFNPLVI